MKAIALFLFADLAAFGSSSLRYEPEEISLQGVIRRQTFPGPPNYEDVAKGDEPETYWILELSAPVDVIGTQGSDLDVSESGVRSMQLVFEILSKKSYKDFPHFVGKHVTVKGQLYHSISGHHKTNVLIKVRDMKKEPSPSLEPSNVGHVPP